MVGRGTRRAPGKRDCIIPGVTDNCLKLRLQPVTLGPALGKGIRNGESVIEAMGREMREKRKQNPEGREQGQRVARQGHQTGAGSAAERAGAHGLETPV